MAKSSIHIEAGGGGYFAHNSREIEAGGGGYFAHNSREAPTVNSIFSDEQNFCSCSKEEAFKTYRSELEKRTEAYKENHNRTKLHAKTITHLSAIVNFNKEHTPEDMRRVCDLLERKFDTKVIQFSMHRDEGHVKEDGTPDKNYHAHIEFMGLDSKGESVRRKLDRPALRELQSDVSKLLKMERGHDYAKEGLSRPKRLDTYPFKHHKQELEKAVKEAVLATQKDLNAEMAQLKSEMKAQGATRADYAQIEQLHKEFKEQIKAKELSNDELKKSLETVRSLRSSDQTKILELSQTVEDLKKDILEISTKPPISPAIVQEYSELKEKYSKSEKTIEALQGELQEAKRPSAAVDISKEIEEAHTKIGEMARIATSNAEVIEELEKAIPTHDPKKVAIAVYNSHIVADTGLMGKFGGEKKDTDLLIANMAKEFQKRDNLAKRLLEQLKKEEITKMSVSNAMKNVVESTKKYLESVFSKITGKSLSEVQKERTELLNAQKERERLGHQKEDRGRER